MVQIKNGAFRWRYHNSSILFFFVIVLLSCNGSKKNQTKKDDIQETIETENTYEVDFNTKKENNASKRQQSDTISEEKLKELIFLKNKYIIPFDFEHNNAVFFKNYVINNIAYNLLKIEYSSTIGKKYLQDPYINFIYVKSKDELIGYSVLYSIEEEDVNFVFNIGDNIFFEQYDSSTGWKKYSTFLKTQSKFIETDKLDEAEEIIQSSINLQDLTYQTNLDNKTKKFKIVK